MGWGMKQLTLATAVFERYAKATRRAVFLGEMERVVPWSALSKQHFDLAQCLSAPRPSFGPLLLGGRILLWRRPPAELCGRGTGSG